MRKMNRWTLMGLIGMILMVAPGCGSSKSSRYYLLNAMDSTPDTMRGHGPAVGIGPIDFPKYLDRPQIVTRHGRNRLLLAEFDRWAEPLDTNFARVLTSNVSELLATANVRQYPWNRSAGIDLQIIVVVERLDAVEGGNAFLQARWMVSDANSRIVVPHRTSKIEEPVEAWSYAAVAQAASRAVESLSRQIVGALQEAEIVTRQGSAE